MKNDIYTVTDFLENSSIKYPQKTAIIENNKKMTYLELKRKSENVASSLMKLGILKGDRVIIIGTNSIDFVVAMFGCLKLGAIFIPLHCSTPISKLQYIIDNSNCKLIITSNLNFIPKSINKTLKEAYCGEFNSFKMVCFPENTTTSGASKVNSVSSTDIAFIIYTSGTTGYAKGVVEQHSSVIFAVNAINSVIKNTHTDRILCTLPLSFDYGLYQIFLSFSVGATIVFIPEMKTHLSIPKILAEKEITGLPIVPSMGAALIHSRLLERVSLPSLRYITSTGDVFYVEYIKILKEKFPHISIFPMYGLTECKRVSILSCEDFEGHETSVGKPLPGTFAYVVDNNGKKLEANETGMLIVGGPHVMLGYWNDKSETRKRFFYDTSSGQRLLQTNDLFKIDSEGFLYYVGRDCFLIKSNGYRVSVTEIEQVVLQLDGINEICAVGINDKDRGQVVALEIFTNNDNISEKEVREHFYKYFSEEIVLKKISINNRPLPKTINGKIDRQAVKRNL